MTRETQPQPAPRRAPEPPPPPPPAENRAEPVRFTDWASI